MAWYRYNTLSGQYLGMKVSSSPWPSLGEGHAQVQDPLIVGAATQNYVYDGTSLRPATPSEIAGFPAADLEVSTIRMRASATRILALTDSAEGQAIRSLMLVVLAEFNSVRRELNRLRAQFNTTTGEVNQLTTTALTPLPMRTKTQLRNAMNQQIIDKLAD